MTSNKFSVLHTPAGASTPVTDITDSIIIEEKDGIKADVDTFRFTVMGKSKYDNFFNDGDRIMIYASTGSDSPSLLMDGFIKELVLNISLDKRTISVLGQNRLEVLLNAPIPIAYSNTGSFNNSALAIKNIINNAQAKWLTSKYRPIITAELRSLGGFIDDIAQNPPLKTFDPPGYSKPMDTPAFYAIEELSTPRWTGADPATVGSYIFYLDTENNFHWEPRINTVTKINGRDLEIGDFIDARIQKTLYDVINFAIIYCGTDFNGRGIKTYVVRPSAQIKGFRGKFFVNNEIAEGAKEALSRTSDLPFANKEKFTGNTDNDTFRTRVREAGKKWGDRILQVYGNPKFKASVTVKGTTAYSKGSLYKLRIPGIFRNTSDLSVNELPMRLTNVVHKLNSKGWMVDLEFIQDEYTITGAAI